METMAQDTRSGPSLVAVTALLSEAKLPSADITAAHLEHFFFCGARSAPTGIVGLELYGVNALLRSLVVAPGGRLIGTGAILLAHVERYARTRGVESLYLLTATAEAYFARHGYQQIDRGQAPPAIRATGEFAGLCPTTSTLMVKQLPLSSINSFTGFKDG